MSAGVDEAQIDAANAYEALFVPALFQQWAPRVADAAQLRPGQRVLDVACGTGVLARELLTRVGKATLVTGIDANPGMVAVAERLEPSIVWRQGLAESLPFSDGSFDAVVSEFGLMFFTDRQRALREMQRLLVTGGRLVVAVWNSLEHNPAYSAVVTLLERTAGRAAADALRAPFVLGRENGLAQLFSEAGIAPVEVSTQQGTARFPSIRTMVEAELRGWLPIMGIHLGETQIDHILREAEHVLKAHVHVNGGVTFPISAHIVAARKA